MPRLALVLDTNIYRTLSTPEMAMLSAALRANSVIICASFWTVMELGAHLADPADPDLRRCHVALKALWDHATQYDGSRQSLRIVADSDSQLALTLFNRSLPGRQAEADKYTYLVETLANSATGDIPTSVQPMLAELRRHRDEIERMFANDMEAVIRGIDPRSTGWQPFPNDPARRKQELDSARAGSTLPFVAAAMLMRASLALGTTLSDEQEMKNMIKYLLDVFPTPAHFYNALLIKSVESGIDYSKGKHANSIWDYQLCFYALAGASTHGIPLALVSNERAVKAAATSAGAADCMMNLQELRERLEKQAF
jgi:hypothetical protein